MIGRPALCFFFFFNDTATTEIYTLSLHDALPISSPSQTSSASWTRAGAHAAGRGDDEPQGTRACPQDRKSTRLNSSHDQISYAVFCLKKKKNTTLSQHACALQMRRESQRLLL